MLSTEYSEQS